MGIIRSISLVFTCIFGLLPADCLKNSRILVVPIDGSHWVNMQVILRELHSRGHKLTVMRSAKSWYIPEKSPLYTSIPIKSLEDDVDLSFYDQMLHKTLEYRKMGVAFSSIYQQWEISNMLAIGHDLLSKAVAHMFDDQVFMDKLRVSNYDLMFTDPGFPIGLLLGNYLHLPIVFNVRWLSTGDSHFTFAPSPISYIPVSGTELSDRMDFLQRTKNLLFYFISVFQEHLIIKPRYREFLQRHFPPGADLLSMQHSADLWLVRSNFVFEFPRPTMPNVIYVGGFQCNPPMPLPAELEDFVQGSGEHGLVVMSLGTLISSPPRQILEAIAAAFAEIPQRVVWRYTGQRPLALGNNTLLVSWFPQNDLLGHPKTRAFVAHGGTNGMYEAIYHGVPVLGLPLLLDQYDNIVRMQVRGAARMLEMARLTKKEFREALQDILTNSTYKKNVQKLSRLQRDQPLSPLENAIFWIEHVIRHKGVPHLRTESYNLPWYSYHSLDVAALLLTLSGFCVWVPLWACRLLYRKASSRERKVD